MPRWMRTVISPGAIGLNAGHKTAERIDDILQPMGGCAGVEVYLIYSELIAGVGGRYVESPLYFRAPGRPHGAAA